jgi:hypothetical protein
MITIVPAEDLLHRPTVNSIVYRGGLPQYHKLYIDLLYLRPARDIVSQRTQIIVG